jgi:hypothetical protein
MLNTRQSWSTTPRGNRACARIVATAPAQEVSQFWRAQIWLVGFHGLHWDDERRPPTALLGCWFVRRALRAPPCNAHACFRRWGYMGERLAADGRHIPTGGARLAIDAAARADAHLDAAT